MAMPFGYPAIELNEKVNVYADSLKTEDKISAAAGRVEVIEEINRSLKCA